MYNKQILFWNLVCQSESGRRDVITFRSGFQDPAPEDQDPGKRTADTNLLKMVPVEILLNFGNYFRTLQIGFWKFLSGIMFLH